MKTKKIKTLYERDLRKLKNEISLYTSENKLWITDKEITNSAGNLCLHLIGNLNHFIGNILGKAEYIRNREEEFSEKNVSKIDLLNSIDETMQIIKDSLKLMNNKQLEEDYPVLKFEEEESVEFLLIHLLLHLNYHLGQINYHRRFFN
ncbi:DUF1572 family protein [Flavobacterium sp. FlaQc-28]|uniref:DUF1572 family protein n=1 Tax=Flavobacterium sp. FlaQc-28 TaxID=3374178 RepID=UPI00375649EC